MHETIAAMVNHYYAGQLNSGRPEQQLPFEQNASTGEGWERILSAGRKIFINSPYESTSKMNKTEAQWVASLLRHLKQKYGPSLPKDRVGVVTPWRTQISLIRELLADDEMLQSINIDTVERFQGSENDIIIASLAVHHPAQLQTLQSIGWFDWEEKEIEVDRKLLVTLSRARQQVILLGHEPVLQSSAHYRKILSEMTQSRL
jgi:superfamily I DNA and/or RNA helicase